MKRTVIIRTLCVFSLLLAAVTLWGWITSFAAETSLFSFTKSGEKWTVKSKWGQVALLGSPPVEESTAAMADLAAKMSDDDMQWHAVAKFKGVVYVASSPRRDSPTWQVYQHLKNRQLFGHGLELPLIIELQKATQDRQRFASAQLITICATSDRRETMRELHGPYCVDHLYQINDSDRQTPHVYMRANPSAVSSENPTARVPDFDLRLDLRPKFLSLMEEKRFGLFYGWIFMAALALPLALMARPRCRDKTRWRWMTNLVALVSLLVCLPSSVMWVRSYWIKEQFMFERQPLEVPPDAPEMNYAYRWIGSTRGQLKLLEYQGAFGFAEPLGYNRSANGLMFAGRAGKARLKGEKYLKLPGIEYYRLPLQTSSRILATSVRGTPGSEMGEHSLVVGWWLLVLASAFLPVLWSWRAWFWWKRVRREKKAREKICPKCGYDMRATPGRCPECGEDSVLAMLNAPSSP